MLYFPQLVTGATVQYPLVKRRVQRNIVSRTPGGRWLKFFDPGGARIEWDLTFQALTSQERENLETFFRQTEGRLGEFTFLDPTDNLLHYSEELAEATWSRGTSLTLTENVADPLGGTRATLIHNSSETPDYLQQFVPGPGNFHYCFSLYARSDTPANLTLFRTAGVVEESETQPVQSNWRRLVHSGRSESADPAVLFGIRIDGGAQVDVFGMQVEAQTAPSDYRRTNTRNGVYYQARFDNDVLRMTSEGPEEHCCTLRIVAFPNS
jgi:hypothetical protein